MIFNISNEIPLIESIELSCQDAMEGFRFEYSHFILTDLPSVKGDFFICYLLGENMMTQFSGVLNINSIEFTNIEYCKRNGFQQNKFNQ